MVRMTDAEKAVMQAQEARRSLGKGTNEAYWKVATEWAIELTAGLSIPEIRKLKEMIRKDLMELQESILTYWRLADSEADMTDLQDDYCAMLSRQVRLLDILKLNGFREP